ncbi:hypothetical protein SDRG_06257 [Saprolegnia diclina VS20]|uniref:Uncharacterized protein n=1 Tax=Saprolegnia diclina (strain VS20) TaxID=1156394 RepID=T0QN44_SAPDV|nr:hypothetical protein SDRG_06257 [Saprolegnia diclina VS20]EQC36141.1 hypothetical protein SDRG_06257 [Saprolegnia diclina VS20]|eukprot:XP_008610247.1 hypothetical protein SDRG_06257 [Saprolegnia diclina VS20]
MAFNTALPPRDAVHSVALMVDDDKVQAAAQREGLQLTYISWEDCARFQNSCWGPCISDMTLVVQDTWMPVLRAPNFQGIKRFKMFSDLYFLIY